MTGVVSLIFVLAVLSTSCTRPESYALVLANPCNESLRVIVYSENASELVGPANDQSFQSELAPGLTTVDQQLTSPRRLSDDEMGVSVGFGDGKEDIFDLGEEDVIELPDGPALIGVIPAKACESAEASP
jgi:hypothetical protein